MREYLFIGGELDGKFVQTNGETDFCHRIYPKTDNAVYLEHERIPEPISIKTEIYEKSVFGNKQKSVVFYAIKGTVLNDDLAYKVFELTQ